MDNFPTVVLEYFSTATPVIGSAVGGIPEMLENGELGLLFKRDDVNELAIQMQRLCEDDNLRNELASKSRQAFEQKYQINVHVDNVVNFINSLP
jgi:glycosyltransferase involved in cell wall biosynthesis